MLRHSFHFCVQAADLSYGTPPKLKQNMRILKYHAICVAEVMDNHVVFSMYVAVSEGLEGFSVGLELDIYKTCHMLCRVSLPLSLIIPTFPYRFRLESLLFFATLA